jgi:hypothetical protein
VNKKLILKLSFTAAVLTVLIGLSVLTSCKCRACSDQEEATVPVEILAKADSFIVSTTGEEFFKKYITPDFYRTKVHPGFYEMAYKFFMPEKPYVNATIKFMVDSVGNIMKNRDIVGIPRCKNFPRECQFNIDEATARQIASKNGLKEGIKEWDAGFLWDFKLKRYVWRILSTLNEFGGEENYKATGQEIVIDPGDGEVLALNDWRIN